MSDLALNPLPDKSGLSKKIQCLDLVSMNTFVDDTLVKSDAALDDVLIAYVR